MRSKSFFKTYECKHCHFKFGGSEVTVIRVWKAVNWLFEGKGAVGFPVNTISSVADEVRQEGVVLNCQQDEI